jgi:SAM-dependent methyltransferase
MRHSREGHVTCEANFDRYCDLETVAHYVEVEGLSPCEEHVFSRFLEPGGALLDLGVGGGRTTPVLSRIAGRYVGVDYVASMVEACRRRFPQFDFVNADARHMPVFDDAAFDAVVFSFNGVDTMGSDADRARCFGEVARILRPKGRFIFSSHNAKALAALPQWSASVNGGEVLYRILRAMVASAQLCWRTLTQGVFLRGSGYILEPTHGGLTNYASTPEVMIPQLEAAGFRVLDVVGNGFPAVRSKYFSGWYYYACEKR